MKEYNIKHIVSYEIKSINSDLFSSVSSVDRVLGESMLNKGNRYVIIFEFINGKFIRKYYKTSEIANQFIIDIKKLIGEQYWI